MYNVVNKKKYLAKEAGFTLIEVLITLLIIAVGLMGTASLQMTGLNSNQGAYLRSQASILAYDMADRMRGNSERAVIGDYTNFTYDAGSKSAKSELTTLAGFAGNCLVQSSGCSASELSANDKYEWAQSLLGAGSGGPLLPNAVGTIKREVGTNVFTVEVAWQEQDWDKDTGVKDASSRTFSLSFTIAQGSTIGAAI